MYLKTAKNIDDFILNFSPEVQLILEKIRACIKKAAPGAEEKISYGIPTFYLKGNLVHFSAYKNHIGFYPGASAVRNFKKELTYFKTSKGTIQFRIDSKIPYLLINNIVKFRVKENLEKERLKGKRKS